jgi:hypothetical protein
VVEKSLSSEKFISYPKLTPLLPRFQVISRHRDTPKSVPGV